VKDKTSQGHITATVTSYHCGKYTLIVHAGTKLHEYTISRNALVALGGDAIRCLNRECVELVNDRDAQNTGQTKLEGAARACN
jgi:hypothetical protein